MANAILRPYNQSFSEFTPAWRQSPMTSHVCHSTPPPPPHPTAAAQRSTIHTIRTHMATNEAANETPSRRSDHCSADTYCPAAVLSRCQARGQVIAPGRGHDRRARASLTGCRRGRECSTLKKKLHLTIKTLQAIPSVMSRKQNS